MVEEPTSIIRSQKFSCRGGHLYFVRTRWSTTSVIVEADDAIAKAASCPAQVVYERVLAFVLVENKVCFGMERMGVLLFVKRISCW